MPVFLKLPCVVDDFAAAAGKNVRAVFTKSATMRGYSLQAFFADRLCLIWMHCKLFKR